MTEMQTAAYVIAQSVAAFAEIEAMKAENHRRRDSGLADAYGEEAFFAVVEKYNIHHNALMTLFNDATK